MGIDFCFRSSAAPPVFIETTRTRKSTIHSNSAIEQPIYTTHVASRSYANLAACWVLRGFCGSYTLTLGETAVTAITKPHIPSSSIAFNYGGRLTNRNHYYCTLDSFNFDLNANEVENEIAAYLARCGVSL